METRRGAMPDSAILTGAPRSGTTLVCSLLNRLPDVVALNETMDVSTLSAMDGNAVRVAAVAQYLADVRQAIMERGEKPERRLRGAGDNMFLPPTGGQRSWAGAEVASIPVGKPLRPGFTLALKHPNAFAALLPGLRRRFDCWAVVRNPLAVLASWHSLDHPIRQGHAPMAEALDPALAQRLAAVADARSRRLALLDWYFQRFLEVLGLERILLYEEIIAGNGACLAGLAPQARQLPKLLDAPLENRNDTAPHGGAAQALEDAQTLLADPNHACWRLYEKAEVAALLAALRSRNAPSTAPPPHEPPAQREPSAPLERRGSPQAASPSRPLASSEPSGAYQPKLSFVIVGAQKCGTTALAEYLRQHPQIGLPLEEGHVFDAPDFSPNWSPQEIDERYAPRFEHCRQAEILGESTPNYLFFPEVAAALRRYNPDLKLIVLLRDRVARAISHYYMQKSRGKENTPLWLALLAQPFRVRCCADARSWHSPQRISSYRSRGLYSRQLSNLHQHFPRRQVQIIHNSELLADHQATLRRVFAFLGVAEDAMMQPLIAFPRPHGAGGALVVRKDGTAKPAPALPKDPSKRRHRVVSRLLRLSYLREEKRAQALPLR